MKKIINQKNLEDNWANFLKKETYLIFDDKERFFNEIKQLTKYPWYYWLVFPLYLKERSNRKKLDKLKQQMITYILLNGENDILELEVSGENEEQITTFLGESVL